MKLLKSRKWDHEMGSQYETDQIMQNQGHGIMKPPKSRKWEQKRKTKINTRQYWYK